MHRLLLIRHAKAEKSEPGMADRARRLVERGRVDAAKIGAYLASHDLTPDRVITSPSARTQETWKFAAPSFPQPPTATVVEQLYDATPHIILDTVKVAGAARILLVIGHNPGLQAAALMLVAAGDIDARERLREKLPTCGLAIIDFAFDDWSKLHARSGRLERFVTPKTLAGAN